MSHLEYSLFSIQEQKNPNRSEINIDLRLLILFIDSYSVISANNIDKLITYTHCC